MISEREGIKMNGEAAYNRIKKRYDKKLTEIRNLKVKIEKLEIKFSEVLDYATGSRISNSGADMNAIERCIDDVINSAVDDYAELVGE